MYNEYHAYSQSHKRMDEIKNETFWNLILKNIQNPPTHSQQAAHLLREKSLKDP